MRDVSNMAKILKTSKNKLDSTKKSDTSAMQLFGERSGRVSVGKLIIYIALN